MTRTMSSKLNTPHKIHEAVGAAEANELLAKGFSLIATHIAFSDARSAKIHYVFGEDKSTHEARESREDAHRADEVPMPRGTLR